MDMYDRLTLFGRLRTAYVDAAKGSAEAVKDKATLIALCTSKFGEPATTAAVAMAEKPNKQ